MSPTRNRLPSEEDVLVVNAVAVSEIALIEGVCKKAVGVVLRLPPGEKLPTDGLSVVHVLQSIEDAREFLECIRGACAMVWPGAKL